MNGLHFLRTFVAVARHGSFSEAAEQVGVTQAAVSFQMRSLETELGRKLFDAAQGRKAFVLVEGGSHFSTNSVGQAQYRNALAELFSLK